MTQKRSRVSNACKRCRQQKLKCDVQKPCTLCLRAEVECIPLAPDVWRISNQQEDSPHHKRQRQSTSHRNKSSKSGQVNPKPSLLLGSEPSDAVNRPDIGATRQTSTEVETEHIHISSSTAALVAEAFAPHEAQNFANPGATELMGVGMRLPAARERLFRSATRRMEVLLPAVEPATVIIDTYFDRIHWFTLLFFQDEFRLSFQTLYSKSNWHSEAEKFGALSRFLAVCALGLHYLGIYRQSLLSAFGIDCSDLKEQILLALRQNLLDILALGGLEATQTCVLLGTFYLYHGEPDLAWPIFGCALRLAQASNLHQQPKSSSKHAESTDLQQGLIESRKRCWWAIYEVESFCSMLYGFPLSISDVDCNIDHLQSSTVPALPKSTVNLLSFKVFMSKLATIVKSALSHLYRMQTGVGAAETRNNAPRNSMRQVVDEVICLDEKLSAWCRELPSALSVEGSFLSAPITYSDLDEDTTLGASSAQFENHILCLQALILRLAYQNTRILIHRPFLLWKPPAHSAQNHTHQEPTVMASQYHSSVDHCYRAALEISNLGSLPIFEKACKTYAAAYVSMHLFTAAISLCIMINRDPLSSHTPEAKLGIQRILQMQSHLEKRSIVAQQGSEILRKLLTLIMKTELDLLLGKQSALTKRQLQASNIGQTDQDAKTPKSTMQAFAEEHQQSTVEILQDSVFAGDHSASNESPFNPLFTLPNLPEDAAPTQSSAYNPQPTTSEASDEYLVQEFDNIFSQEDLFNDDSFLEQQQAWMWAVDFGSIAN